MTKPQAADSSPARIVFEGESGKQVLSILLVMANAHLHCGSVEGDTNDKISFTSSKRTTKILPVMKTAIK
jgi:hypothetical protein